MTVTFGEHDYKHPYSYEVVDGNDTDYLLEFQYEDILDHFDDNDI